MKWKEIAYALSFIQNLFQWEIGLILFGVCGWGGGGPEDFVLWISQTLYRYVHALSLSIYLNLIITSRRIKNNVTQKCWIRMKIYACLKIFTYIAIASWIDNPKWSGPLPQKFFNMALLDVLNFARHFLYVSSSSLRGPLRGSL